MMIGWIYRILFHATVLFAWSTVTVWADIEYLGDLTYGPKRSPGAALIGEVAPEKMTSSSIRMVNAVVDIYIGVYPDNPDGVTSIRGKGVFALRNESEKDVRVVIGFPLGDRRYSNYRFKSFAVRHGGRSVPVFAGSGGFKTRWKLAPIVPMASEKTPILPVTDDEIHKSIVRGLWIAGKKITQTVLWEATFPAMKTQIVEVEYAIDVPWQYPDMITRKIKGTRKAQWLSADSVFPSLSSALDAQKEYLFFDYVLATGASWKGPIGKEVIRIHLDSSWQDVEPTLFVTPRQVWRGGAWEKKAEDVSINRWEKDVNGRKKIVFKKSDFEPTEKDDLYFALEHRY